MAIVDQITGKARGGGVHQGLRRSLNTGSLVLAWGRELSKGENTRLFNAINNENNPTKYEAIVSIGTVGTTASNLAGRNLVNTAAMSGKDSKKYSWNKCRNERINPHWMVVAEI